jgi:hypothetical protein
MLKSIMVKKALSPKKTAVKTPAKTVKKAGLKLVIDYPTVHEVVRPGHYAIRLTAVGATQAQVRFDGDGWSECRESFGHFWYDWAPQSGLVRIEVRARAGNGRWTAAQGLDAVIKPFEVCLAA